MLAAGPEKNGRRQLLMEWTAYRYRAARDVIGAELSHLAADLSMMAAVDPQGASRVSAMLLEYDSHRRGILHVPASCLLLRMRAFVRHLLRRDYEPKELVEAGRARMRQPMVAQKSTFNVNNVAHT
jgi:hypothetical protein